jgi:DUSAM domain-containing protein
MSPLADDDDKGEFYPRGDWDLAAELERRLDTGERLILDDETLELLRLVGADVGLSADDVLERLRTLEGAEQLLREERARISQGSRAMAGAMKQAWVQARAGDPDAGRALLEEFARSHPVLWHCECARREADRIRRWVEATRTKDGA